MKGFLVLSLVGLFAVGQGRLISSMAKSSSWNSFLSAQNIFPANVDNTLDFNGRDGLTVQQQLEAVLGPRPNLENIYQNYLTTFKLNVAPSPLATRLELFKQTLHDIAVHNAEAQAGVHTWTKGVTRFADRTAEELAVYLPTNAPSPTSRNETTVFEDSEYFGLYQQLLKTAPDSLDYRKDGIVTPCKDQGAGCKGGGGSCYAFAASGQAESAYAKNNGGNFVLLSEYEIITCGEDGRAIMGCNGGDRYWALKFMKNGLAQETDMPVYAGTVSGQMTCPADTKSKDHFAKVLKIEYPRQGDEQKLLALLLAHGPIGVSVGASNGWFSYNKDSGVYDGDCANEENHSVMVVGYTPEAWIIKNSWGNGNAWGDDGFMLLKRGVNKCSVGNTLTAITSLG